MKNLSIKFALTALVLITLALASAFFFPMLQDYKFEKKIDALSAQESALYNKLRYEHPLISKEKMVEAVKLPKFFRDTFIQNKIAELKGQGRQTNVKVAAEKATQRIVPSAASREVLHINSFYLGMSSDQVIRDVKKANAEGIDIISVATQEGGHRTYRSGSRKSSRRFEIWLDGDSDRVVRVMRTKKFDIQVNWPQIRQQIVDIYGEPDMASKADSYWDFCYGDCQVAILESHEKDLLEEIEKSFEKHLSRLAGKELSPSDTSLIRTYERTIARTKNELAIRENGSGLRIYFYQRDDSAGLNFDLVNWPWVEERGLKIVEARERAVEDEVSGKSNIH